MERILLAVDPSHIDVWAVFPWDDLDQMEKVYQLERELAPRFGTLAFEVHTILLAHVREENLPQGRVIFQRS